MNVKLLKMALITTLLALVPMTDALAAGSSGFRLFANDSESMGKGFAITGEADNPSAVFYNPAGLTQLKGATHFSLGASAIQPMGDHSTPAGVESHMRRDTFYLPHMYAVSDFGMDRVVFGFGTTSNWGLATRWNTDSFSGYAATNTEIENVDTTVTMSYKFSDQFSMGIGAVHAYSKFNLEQQVQQFGTTDAQGQLKGDDRGLGYSVSALYAPNEVHQFGLIYRSPIELTYRGNVTAFGLNNASVVGSQQYQGIFGGTSYSTPFEADLQLPQIVTMGYSFRPTPRTRFNFDVDWTDWSSIETEYVRFPDEFNATRLAVLDALSRQDRDWRSTVSYALGAEYYPVDQLALRLGAFYTPSPIPNDTFDSSLPITDGYGVTAGFGYNITPNSVLDMAWTTIFYEDYGADNGIASGLGVGISLDGQYSNIVNIASVTYGYSF